MKGLDVGIYAVSLGALGEHVAQSLAARGARVSVRRPSQSWTLAWRLARRFVRSSVAARMAARAGYERAFAVVAQREIARRAHDVVVTDLAVARGTGRVRGGRHVLILERGPAAAIHAALDAELDRAPAFARHLRNFRASAAACARETEAISGADRVLVPSLWIARAAGTRPHTVTVAPPHPRPVWWRGQYARGRRLRVLVPGPLIGRNGARPLLECARAMVGEIEVRVAGRVADDPQAVAPYAGLFEVAAGRFEDECAWADVVVAPWLIDGYCREVAVALASGIPTIATEATGVDLTTPGVLVVDEGSTEALVTAIAALRGDDVRAALPAPLFVREASQAALGAEAAIATAIAG